MHSGNSANYTDLLKRRILRPIAEENLDSQVLAELARLLEAAALLFPSLPIPSDCKVGGRGGPLVSRRRRSKRLGRGISPRHRLFRSISICRFFLIEVKILLKTGNWLVFSPGRRCC